MNAATLTRPCRAVSACVGILLSAASFASAAGGAATPPGPAAEDPQRYIAFVEDFTASCVQRNGVQVLVRSTHPSRKLRVWLDRFHMGVGTGDRSRSDLAPAGEPLALGCSRTTTGVQEWRIVRATWID